MIHNELLANRHDAHSYGTGWSTTVKPMSTEDVSTDENPNEPTEGTEPAQAQAQPATPVATKPTWRDRLWSWKALLATALITLILGGLMGAGVGAATAHHRMMDRRHDFVMRHHGGFGEDGRWRMGQGQMGQPGSGPMGGCMGNPGQPQQQGQPAAPVQPAQPSASPSTN